MSGAFLEVQQADMTVQSQSNSKAGATPRKRAVDLELDDGKEGIRGGKSDMAPPQRRGTPYPSKKMKEFDANNASGAMLPPPIFHRTESAVLCGIPPYPPNNKAIMFDDNDLEEKQKVRCCFCRRVVPSRGVAAWCCRVAGFCAPHSNPFVRFCFVSRCCL